MSNPIPVKDRAAFKAHMDERKEALSWHTTNIELLMLDEAEEFMIKKRYLRGDPDTALRYYNEGKM